MYGLFPIPFVFTMDSPAGHRNIDDVRFSVLDESSDEDQAFWAGLVSGGIVLTGGSMAVATIVGAEGGAAAGMILAGGQILAENPAIVSGLGTLGYSLPILAGGLYLSHQLTMTPGMEDHDPDTFILTAPGNAIVNWLFPGLEDWTFMDQS